MIFCRCARTFVLLACLASCQKESALSPPLTEAGAAQTEQPATRLAPVSERTSAQAGKSVPSLAPASNKAALGTSQNNEPARSQEPVQMAVARMVGLGDHPVRGPVSFLQLPEGQGVKVAGTLRGLKPGKHGFHVHEHGACGKDGTLAGGHFNPAKTPHGGPGDVASHVGDMGNIAADADGIARIAIILPAATLKAGPNSLIGRALIVHEGVDDLSSQPAGDSGPRVACAIITGP